MVSTAGSTPQSTERIRVAILAAHPVVRAGVRFMLHDHETVVLSGEATSSSEAMILIASQEPDVVVLDPDSHPFALRDIPTILGTSASRVLIFTAEADPTLHHEAVALGAMGVVLKHHSGDTLARAVEKVFAGEVWLERRTTASMIRGFMSRGLEADAEAPKIRALTKRELEVISLVGSGLKSHAVAERLFISHATVRNHLTSILSKLQLSDQFELAFYAVRHGLVHPQTESTRRPA